MEISETLAHYLRSLDLADPIKGEKSFKLNETEFESFRSGQQFIPLLKHFPNFDSQSFDLLKNIKSSSARLYNWKVIFKLLTAIHVDVDLDWQQQILNGDSDLIVALLEKIMKKHKKLSSPSAGKGKRPRPAPEGALYIETIDPKRDLNLSNSCLEFLILSFCQSFEIQPKQAAGLLTQGNKFLAHILVKGLKGNHEKVQNWYSLLISRFHKIKQLIQSEIEKGSLSLVLNAAKPGFISKQGKTIERCSDFISLVYLEIDAKDQLWDWFCTDTVELCALAVKRSDEYTGSSIAKVLLALRNEHLFDVVSEKLKKGLEAKECLTVMQNLYTGLTRQKDKVRESGIVDFYLHYSLTGAELGLVDGKNCFGLGKLNLLLCLWRDFYEDVSETSHEILIEVKRVMKDCSVHTKILILGQLFDLISLFASEQRESSGIILKTLIFSLIENYEHEHMREFMLQNFIVLMDSTESLPMAAVLDPLLKQIQYFQSIRFNVVDHEFFLTVARHPRTTLENIVILLDVLSKAFLEDLLFARACEFTLIHIISTFFSKNPVAEYTFKLCELTFALVCANEVEKHAKADKKNLSKAVSSSQVEANIAGIQRNRIIFDLFIKLIKLRNPFLNEFVQKAALNSNWQVKKQTKANSKGFELLLSMLGDAEELIRSFEVSALVPYAEPGPSESNMVAYKPPAITGRAAEDIEKIKNLRKAALDKKAREEEEMKKKQQRLYEAAKNDVNKYISKQDKIGILDANQANCSGSAPAEYFDLPLEPKNESELIEKVSRRFALPLKLLFNKYCKPVIVKQKPDLNAFDENSLNEAQFLALLKGEMIVPQRMKREDAVWLLKEMSKREGADYVKVSRKVFHLALFQIACNVFRAKPLFEVTPLATRFLDFISFLRDNEKNPKIYDEPDPGPADRKVILYLNEKLKTDLNFPLPQSIYKCNEFEFNLVYQVPKEVKIRKAARVAIEIIDSILFSALSVHFLRPALKVSTLTVARGANISDNPTMPILPIYLTVSPNMKYNILRLTDKYPLDCLVDTGKLLEDLLTSAISGKTLKFSQSSTLAKNNFLKQKEFESTEIENKKVKAEALRKQRKAQLDDFLKQKKAELEKQEELESQEKERKMKEDNKKIAEQEERKLKELNEKKKMVEDWKNRKNEEEKVLKEKKEKLKPDKSASQSLLPLINKRLSEITKKSKKNEKTAETPKTPKGKNSTLTLSKVLSESKRHIEFEQKRKEQFLEYFNQGSVKEVIYQYSQQLRAVFLQYLKLTMNTSDPDSGLSFKGLNKFCLDFSIQPQLVQTSFITNSFNRLTKEKAKSVNFENFIEFLSEVSFTSEQLKEPKELIDSQTIESSKPEAYSFTSLMQYMKIPSEVKQTKKK